MSPYDHDAVHVVLHNAPLDALHVAPYDDLILMYPHDVPHYNASLDVSHFMMHLRYTHHHVPM